LSRGFHLQRLSLVSDRKQVLRQRIAAGPFPHSILTAPRWLKSSLPAEVRAGSTPVPALAPPQSVIFTFKKPR